jgi:hypothetical protein
MLSAEVWDASQANQDQKDQAPVSVEVTAQRVAAEPVEGSADTVWLVARQVRSGA